VIHDGIDNELNRTSVTGGKGREKVRYVSSLSILSVRPAPPVRIPTMRPSLARTMDPESPASENLPCVLS
jgi:hypothetical protein